MPAPPRLPTAREKLGTFHKIAVIISFFIVILLNSAKIIKDATKKGRHRNALLPYTSTIKQATF